MNSNKENTSGKREVVELIERYRNEIGRLKEELEKAKKGGEDKQMQENPFYEDMERAREQVEKFAAEHNLTPQQAYGALFGEKKYDEKSREEKMKKAKISALSQNGNKGEDFEEGVLSKNEHWAAKKAGMSLQDYLKYKKRGNE